MQGFYNPAMNDPNDPTGTGKALEATAKVLDSEIVKNLFSPITKQIGDALGSLGDLTRFYMNQNLEKIFTKWSQHRNGQVLPPTTDFPKLLPYIEQARFQSEDELQELFANLLESVVSTRKGTLPSFARTISDLTPESARYLLNISDTMRANHLIDVTLLWLLEIYERTTDSSIEPRQVIVPDVKGDSMGRILIADFLRLGILETLPAQRLERLGMDYLYRISSYGRAFIRAVEPYYEAKPN